MFGSRWRRSSPVDEPDRQREFETARQLSVQLPFADAELFPDPRASEFRTAEPPAQRAAPDPHDSDLHDSDADDHGPDNYGPDNYGPDKSDLDESDPGVRLSRLGLLRDQGSISDEEYTARRRRIFD